ncbi:MAG: tRNA 4-thiouridine(8) synthase ThiI [Clostridiales bacterium]|jgi:thiamine biosynthesis protein ThiI|nr:tRNA 4-thiouridine(8) synthase ThiI [Clostridiales bacterium]
MYKLLLVRYGELGLKGKNRNQFINCLVKNIKAALSDLPPRRVESTWGRILIEVGDDFDLVVQALSQVFGIYSFSPVLEASWQMEAIFEAALQVLLDALPAGGSFKVESKRSDKNFPLESPEISRRAASYLFDRIGEEYRADMHHPEATVNIEIRTEGAYVYGQSLPGAKGLPVGCGGRVMLLLSGGIDSPVAGWMAMKRGAALEAVHFHSFPFTGEKSKEKVIDLCRLLSRRQGAPVKLHVVHFTEMQKAIHEHCREEYGITIMRRMMFRIAEKIARRRSALALYTGESLGQVASQTLESMSVINDVVKLPVLRPLVGLDKEEIIKIAQQIGSFETSILPYEDCCTIFLPNYPKIRPRINETEAEEAKFAWEELLKDCLGNIETLVIGVRD